MNVIRTAVLSSGLMLAGLFAAAPASAQDLNFTLSNATSYHLVQFFASPSDVGSWEEDILGMQVLNPGESANVTIADGRTQCDYDLLMVFSDGDQLTDSVNLCDTGSYTIYE